jgi:hypothetical protein
MGFYDNRNRFLRADKAVGRSESGSIPSILSPLIGGHSRGENWTDGAFLFRCLPRDKGMPCTGHGRYLYIGIVGI